MNPLNHWRLTILILGPLPILAASILLSQWAHSEPPAAPADNQAVVRGQIPGPAPATPADDDGALARECDAIAQRLGGQLGPTCGVIVRSPFVIAGDMDRRRLELRYNETIGPASRAMAKAYFRTPPNRAITVLLFSGEESYNRYAKALFGEEGISVYGYYKPSQRTLVMNIGTGGGTLVHELTHALIDFDFPAVPAWFNEGLASLHEACQIHPDQSGIDGQTNWRLPGLQKAIREGRAHPLEELVALKDFRGEGVGLNYAEARYFCLYMQQQGVLVDYFRRFRASHKHDPTGAQTILAVFPGKNWRTLNADFQSWALKLEYGARRP